MEYVVGWVEKEYKLPRSSIDQVIVGSKSIKSVDKRTVCEIAETGGNVSFSVSPDTFTLSQLASKEKTFHVFVKTLSGMTLTLGGVWECQTVCDFKRRIQIHEGMAPEQQRLIFGGMQLEDEQTLQRYRVLKGVTLHLVLRLRGGMFHETSARQGFSSVPKRPPITLNLILPNGDRRTISHYQDDSIDSLKKQALALVGAGAKCNKHLKTSDAHNGDAIVSSIDNLRADLLAATSEKTRLSEAMLVAEMDKERLTRGEEHALSSDLAGMESNIAALRAALFDAELKRKNAEQALEQLESTASRGCN